MSPYGGLTTLTKVCTTVKILFSPNVHANYFPKAVLEAQVL